MPDANLLPLEEAASRLGTLLDDVVFVGGATLALLITDPGAAPVRATVDVDVIAEITTYMEYFDFSERLRQRGFKEDSGEHPLNCRWIHGKLILDVMPTENGILGSINRWYKDALKLAQIVSLPSGTAIRVIDVPHFLGTKFEAFRGRGNHDFSASRDLEDVVAVIDGREVILEELAAAPPELRRYLAEAVGQLLSESRFLEVLPGYFLPDDISQQRVPGMLGKLGKIAAT